MKSPKEYLQEIEADLRLSPTRRVLYLEGKTDAEAFAALLGSALPRPSVIDDVIVRGLSGKTGSGGSQVLARVEAAAALNIPGVYGILDGDGEAHGTLRAGFDGSGPLFTWPAYCIENMLARTAWPAEWGPLDEAALSVYAPYVGLNRLGVAIRRDLESMRLHKFLNPEVSQPIGLDTVRDLLARGRSLLLQRDVVADFEAEVQAFLAALHSDLPEAHCRLNGKWLLSHLAASNTHRTEEDNRAMLCAHVRAAGGNAEVQAFWSRLRGTPP